MYAFVLIVLDIIPIPLVPIFFILLYTAELEGGITISEGMYLCITLHNFKFDTKEYFLLFEWCRRKKKCNSNSITQVVQIILKKLYEVGDKNSAHLSATNSHIYINCYCICVYLYILFITMDSMCTAYKNI